MSIQTLTHNLSFSTSLAPPQSLLFPKPPFLSLSVATQKPWQVIRMGGGPRTYPGGVSKWQWKRMQAKKAKQLLKARLCRERQIYEMRKRAELRAAASELERPWEAVDQAAAASAPTLFSVSADEQVKVLADRFQRPGGFDLWTENDGPQLFRSPDELPTARFFPKGVVHSVKPYRRVSESEGLSDEESFGELGSEYEDVEELREQRGGNGDQRRSGGSDSESLGLSLKKKSNGFRRNRNGNVRKLESFGSNGSALLDSELSVGEFGEMRNSNNDMRSYERKFGGRLAVAGENRGSLNSNRSNGLRGIENGQNYRAFDSDGSEKRFSGKRTVLGQQRNGNNRMPYGRKSGGRSGSFSGRENENGELLDSKSSNSKNSLEQKSGGFRRKGNGKSYGSSNLRNGYDSSDSGFDRKQRMMRGPNIPSDSGFDRKQRVMRGPSIGSDSGFDRKQRVTRGPNIQSDSGFDRKQRVMRGPNIPRSEGRYIRGNGARTVSNSESEVFDMSLEQDGRYGFQSKNVR